MLTKNKKKRQQNDISLHEYKPNAYKNIKENSMNSK